MNWNTIIAWIGAITGSLSLGIETWTYWMSRPKIKAELSEIYDSMTVSQRYLLSDKNKSVPVLYAEGKELRYCIINLKIANKGTQSVTIDNISALLPKTNQWISFSGGHFNCKDIPISKSGEYLEFQFAPKAVFPLRLSGNDVKEVQISFLSNFLDSSSSVIHLRLNLPTYYKEVSWKIPTLEDCLSQHGCKLSQ